MLILGAGLSLSYLSEFLGPPQISIRADRSRQRSRVAEDEDLDPDPRAILFGLGSF